MAAILGLYSLGFRLTIDGIRIFKENSIFNKNWFQEIKTGLKNANLYTSCEASGKDFVEYLKKFASYSLENTFSIW